MTDRRPSVLVEINPGKRELDLKALPRVLANLADFLQSLAEDSGCRSELKWTGTAFHGGSLGLRALGEPVPDTAYLTFDKNLRSVVQSKHDSNGLSRRTWDHYVKITDPFESDDRVRFGLPPENLVEQQQEEVPLEQMEWFELTKESIKLNPDIRAKVDALGEVQGYLYSIVLGSKPPYFVIKDQISSERLKCFYDIDAFGQLVKSLKGKEKGEFLVRVSGTIRTDMLTSTVDVHDIKHIELLVGSLTDDDINKFLGCAPNYLDDDELQEMIRDSRDSG